MVGCGWFHQVRFFRAPTWCPSGRGGTPEAGCTVAKSLVGRSSALSDEYAPASANAEGRWIVDEPGVR